MVSVILCNENLNSLLTLITFYVIFFINGKCVNESSPTKNPFRVGGVCSYG